MGDFINSVFMDGINLNLNEALTHGSDYYNDLTQLISQLIAYFHQELPGSQISFNVPWTPKCKSKRCFDFLAISHMSDLFFVESFNIPNDMREGCVATTSSSYHNVLTGLTDYIKLGVDSRKLVMGVPWSGYDYTCKRFSEAGICELEMTSQDDPCSYTAAVAIQYKAIMQRLPRSLTGRFWSDDQKAPYFVYMDGKTYHQVWYDDPESISMKSTFLKRLKLGGIGVWSLADVDYNGTAWATLHAEEMWNALCPP
ncbi:di-N-acetylchitobiase-like [Leucoraja erinacea]|uniref:di-N-acetylchitobiase-like n=1 Tax=Leucoraja erinaceus TaxID=7782 RepID=UPI0024590E77|nr:di-N-acetylchitobiase-like [Leucoraja erinacea]